MVFLALLGALVLALVLTAGAVYLGWIPIPQWVVNTVASSRGLSVEQARSLNRLANVYQVLRSAPESKLLDRALGLAAQGAGDDAWVGFLRDAWPQISAETKGRLRDQLQMDGADFAGLDALITRGAAGSDGFPLGDADQKFLRNLDAKYGVGEMVRQLRKGKER